MNVAAEPRPMETLRFFGAPGILFSTLLIVAAWAALELWGLGKAPFHTKGEPREGLVVWEMTHGGGWILPRRNGVELPSKPPLFHWLGALTSLVHGATDEWSIRFPSAALSLAALLCVFATGAALWSARAGCISALALMTMFEWARAATGARVDMTLTFGLQLALLSLLFFLRRRAAGWLIPLYFGITLAVLGKGPVGAVLPGTITLVMLAVRRDVSILRSMRLAWGAAVVGVGAGSWYLMALLLGGWEFFRKQVLAENVFTFLHDPDFAGGTLGAGGHLHSVGYLLGALLLGLLPWTFFLPGVVERLWRQRRELSREDPRVYLLVWVAVVFGFYAAAASKRSVYLLGLYPAIALLLGWWWDEQSRAPRDEERWLASLLRPLAWVLLAVVVLITLAALLESFGVLLSGFAARRLPAAAGPMASWVGDAIHAQRWLLLGFLLTAAASFYGTIWASRTANWMGILVGIFSATAALTLSVSQVILPGIAQHQSLRTLMSSARELIGPSGDLFFLNAFEYGAVFYWRGHIGSYEGPWPAGAPRYLLVYEDEWTRREPLAEGQYERVTFPGDDNLGDHGRLVLIRRIREHESP